MDPFGAIVIGGGVVGIATARALAIAGHDTLILEAQPEFGSETSSRNSEVIHAGIYYPPGSLKARLCIEGKQRLYALCEERGIPHRRTGKLIFAASDEQIATLEGIQQLGAASGVADLIMLSGPEAAAMEPMLDCRAALYSPSTGIVDSHALMLAMLGEAEAHGAALVCNAPVARITRGQGAWDVQLADADGTTVSAQIVVNAAGLGAQRLATATEGLPPAAVPPLSLAKGRYFSVSGKAPFSHLIYPVPVPGGLGTHLTIDLAGQARFGPDVAWIDAPDYHVEAELHAQFLAAARQIWPGLDADRLHPGFAGIRPKLSGPGAPAADFVISGPEDHGLDGLVNLFGIESPGLTASLAIAQEVLSAASGDRAGKERI